jgi:hypothetical protein
MMVRENSMEVLRLEAGVVVMMMMAAWRPLYNDGAQIQRALVR